MRDEGKLLSSSSSGQRFKWKAEQDMAPQSQGSPSPGFATLSQPQILQELLPLLLQKGNSLSNQPCSPNAAQRLQPPPRGSCSCTEGIQTSDPTSRPQEVSNRFLSQLEPRFHASSKGNIPGYTPHVRGTPQCLHAGAVPHRRFVFMASPSPANKFCHYF